MKSSTSTASSLPGRKGESKRSCEPGPARPRRSRLPVRAAGATLLPVVLLLAAPANAATFRAEYRITLAGLTLGGADLTGATEGDRYELKMRAQLTGLAGLFTSSGRGGADAAGTLGSARLVPTTFTATGRSSSAERTVRMGLAGSTATSVSIEPPFEPRPDLGERVPLAEADKRGVIDPLSGVVVLAQNRARPFEPANCNRTIPVFDGTQRFNLVLSYGETRAVRKPGYAGDVLVCNARYVPVAGHRPSRPSVRFMQDTRDISVWLAPVEGTRLLVPMRISVATMLGTTVVEAEKWNVD